MMVEVGCFVISFKSPTFVVEGLVDISQLLALEVTMSSTTAQVDNFQQSSNLI